MTTIKKKTSYLLLIVLGIIILFLAFLPGLIKDYAINNSKELIGRKIDIGKLKYNYFSSTVKVYDFKMFEQNEQDYFTTFDTLILNLEPIKLLIDKIEIEQFYLKGLMVKAVMKDSTFSFDDLIAFHSEPVDSLTTEEPEPFKYSISNIELKESNFYFDDQNVGKETHIEDLSFSIPQIGWDQEEKSNASIIFNFKKGGYLESSLNINPVDGEYDALITIKDLYLNPFYEYIAEYAEINDFKGLLNSQIKIEGNTNEVVNSIVSGHLDISDFVLTDKNDRPFLKANRIDCNLKNIDYANSYFVLDSIKFTKPYVYFEMDSIKNNFFKIFKIAPESEITNEKGEAIEATDTTSNSNLYYAINHLMVQDGIVDYSDNLTGERFDYYVSEIRMDSDSIFSNSERVRINSDMVLNNKGILNAELGLNPIDGEFGALVSVKDLELKPFYQYVIEYAEINDFNGRVNSKIEIKGNTNEPTNSIVSGHVDVHDFVMTDRNNKEFLKAKRVDFNMKKVDYSNSYYDLDSLKLSQPYAYFELDSITNNFFKIFKIESDSEVNDVDEEDSNLYYAINHLILKDGVLDYSDNLTGERFDYHLSNIEMNTESILSDAKWVNINSDMLLNNRGTLHSELGLNPSDYNNLNLDMTIEKFLLSDINIYSKYYTGHNILEGDFYYYSQSKITNGDIESENRLLVKNVSVSNEEGGLYALPLRFALFLLKDKNGDVNLEVPVRGDVNDPEVSVGKIVWNTFKNLIVKTVASPINFLAGLVDGDPKEFEELKFSYTDTIPSEKQFRKLDKLLEMETKKEGLKIEMIHYVDKKLQQEAIVISELGKQYFKDTEKDYLKDEKGFESYLRIKASNDSIPLKEVAFRLIKPETADSLATIVNTALMKNTQEYLTSSKDATNITIRGSELKEPINIGSLNKFKIKYDMLDEQNIKNDTINTKN
jgi:hypothetical protein